MTPERWQQVKGVLHGALELTPEQRAAFRAGGAGGSGAESSQHSRGVADGHLRGSALPRVRAAGWADAARASAARAAADKEGDRLRRAGRPRPGGGPRQEYRASRSEA